MPDSLIIKRAQILHITDLNSLYRTGYVIFKLLAPIVLERAVNTVIYMRTKSHQVSHTALHWASARGRKTFVVRLLMLGANVHFKTKDEEGMAPLHSATISGHGDVVKLLLENGVDIEAKNQEGWTPLLCVSITGGHQLARLEKGVDIASSGQKYLGWTALHYAAVLGRLQVVDLLIKMGSRIGATDILRIIPNAVVAEEKRIVRLLLSHLGYGTALEVPSSEYDLDLRMLIKIAKSEMSYRLFCEHGILYALYETLT